MIEEWARVIGVSRATIRKMMDRHRLDGDILIEVRRNIMDKQRCGESGA